MHEFIKDPDAELDYGFDLSDWLATGESLASVVWDVPTGLTNENEDLTATTAVVWLSGGTVGNVYQVSCEFTTDDSRVDERSFRIYVAER
jgi:hypothetical protein